MLAFAVLALAASASAAPIAALATVEAALALPNTTQTNAAVYYMQNGNAGACGLYSQDSDLVVGLPTEFYAETGVVSSYCGTYLVVKSEQNNMTVTARVADASATNQTLSLSMATWNALNGTESHLETVQWRFANETETAAAKKALGSDSASSSTAAPVAASPAAQQTQAEAAAPSSSSTSAAAQKAAETTPAKAPETKTTEAYVAPTTTTKAYVAPTTTTKAYVAPTTTQAPAPAATQKSYSSASSGSYSGTATYFFQGGNPGNCGVVHSDSDYIVALTSSMYSGGSHCGQGVKICSTSTGRCVSATVADSCPSCSSSGDLDLSEAAFNAIASPSDGVTPISWSFA